ncbi:hypothetical protein IFT47_17820 [Pseudomonas sp. CFBP 13711]|uniref:hypothetical protein n=1 Tax=unclassified Pseudomonas TaxID=196821 RepID=UPI001782C407|nr:MULTISPECIES: hypothetical protein [unclassified Pseudomonas]MBD8708490.1 hypothetical protein [Pseudomonas sp. CFBP 13711]MBD8713932.1 hypothetical protein [Pseudomonas sp. CFBP 13715]
MDGYAGNRRSGLQALLNELYLYAALLELDLFVNKEHEAPDFEMSDGRGKVFIEAVTVGPSPRDEPPPKPMEHLPLMRSLEEVRELLKTRAPIRFGSALYSKLNRKNKYWDLEQIQGHPLVFAIADFHEDQSMTWSSPALMEYLYAISDDASFDDNNQLAIEPQKSRLMSTKAKRSHQAISFSLVCWRGVDLHNGKRIVRPRK